jgi:hypothetical protein
MAALPGIGEIPQGQVAGELVRGEGGAGGWHGVSFERLLGRGSRPPTRWVA